MLFTTALLKISKNTIQGFALKIMENDTIVSKEGLLQSFFNTRQCSPVLCCMKGGYFPKTYIWVYDELQLQYLILNMMIIFDTFTCNRTACNLSDL